MNLGVFISVVKLHLTLAATLALASAVTLAVKGQKVAKLAQFNLFNVKIYASLLILHANKLSELKKAARGERKC